MATQTHTVTASWQSGTGFWVAANGIIGSLKADVARIVSPPPSNQGAV